MREPAEALDEVVVRLLRLDVALDELGVGLARPGRESVPDGDGLGLVGEGLGVSVGEEEPELGDGVARTAERGIDVVALWVDPGSDEGEGEWVREGDCARDDEGLGERKSPATGAQIRCIFLTSRWQFRGNWSRRRVSARADSASRASAMTASLPASMAASMSGS
jgi:hypothetical protein